MIENIRRFITIVDNRSVTKAAQILNITQPALSLSLKRLENETNTKLFLRTGKQFVITSDGQALYKIGIKILELWERAKNPTTRLSASTNITIGIFDNAALKLAPFIHKQLGKTDIQVEIKIDNSQQLLQNFSYGVSDMCICVVYQHTVLPKDSIVIKKFSEELIPVASKKMTINSISNIPFILYKKGSITRNFIDNIFFTKGINPNIVAESTSTTFMKELAMTGSGVTLLPKNFVIGEIKNKKLFIVKLPFKFYREIGILLHKEGILPASDKIVKEIISYFD